LTESSGNPKKFWKTVITTAKSLLIDGVLISKPGKIASSFCEFFSNIAAKVKKKSIRLKDFSRSKPVTTNPKTYSSVKKTLKKKIDRS